MLDQLKSDLAAAMRAGEAERTGVLRLLIASFTNERIKLGHDLDETEGMKLLQRELKQRQDSIVAYRQGGREELAAAEEAELGVIKSYLPEALDEAEVGKLVEAAITQTGATTKAQMGQVIAAVMAAAGGRADGATVARLAAQRLT